jgi:hypothetical protein
MEKLKVSDLASADYNSGANGKETTASALG